MGGRPCYLSCVQGKSFTYTGSGGTSLDGRARLEFNKGVVWRSLAELGVGYEELAVDAIPARDRKVNGSLLMQQDVDCKIPSMLRRPLMKVPTTGASEFVQGFCSGLRSALWRSEDGRWWRLKGCGNEADGFVVVPVLDDMGEPVYGGNGKALVKLRGCAYAHTSAAELDACADVDMALSKLGMRCELLW